MTEIDFNRLHFRVMFLSVLSLFKSSNIQQFIAHRADFFWDELYDHEKVINYTNILSCRPRTCFYAKETNRRKVAWEYDFYKKNKWWSLIENDWDFAINRTLLFHMYINLAIILPILHQIYSNLNKILGLAKITPWLRCKASWPTENIKPKMLIET